jgi:putative ABC transport system substrate-binding protein
VFDAFREGMRELGYAEGRNIVVVVREADGKIERFPALARELVGLKVDVIVATNSLTGRAVRRATTRIPTIVQKAGTVHDALRTVALEEVTEVVTRKEIG